MLAARSIETATAAKSVSKPDKCLAHYQFAVYPPGPFGGEAPRWARLTDFWLQDSYGWSALRYFWSCCSLPKAVLRCASGWHGPTGDAEAAEGYLLSATLALLGLLIAFTFSLAISRFDARRQLVVNEANAIGTALAPCRACQLAPRRRVATGHCALYRCPPGAFARPRPWRSRARNSRSTKGRLGHARPDHCHGTACTRQFHGDRRQ